MLLAVTPDIFHRIEFWRVGRQELQLDSSGLLSDKLAHQPAAVHGQSIPDDCQTASDVPLQVLQKLNYLGCLDAASKQTEVKIPNGDTRHGREALPIEGILKHRRLTPRCPGAHPMGTFAQAALVHKHYGATLLEGFFFISGQRTRFQRRMAVSSRWSARPTGRWQLQPRDRRIRQTWPG